MLAELEALMAAVRHGSPRTLFRRAIIEDNVLGKRTVSTRRKTARLLAQLYGLDPGVTVFRALVFFWEKDPSGRPLIALLCAASRDPLLRLTTGAVLPARPDDIVPKTDLEKRISQVAPGHFATSTVQKIARNAASSWTQSGHLQGRRVKRRARPKVTPATVAYALLLGYLAGASGQMLLTTFWAQLLDAPEAELTSLAADASARGWIVYRQSGHVMEVRFPDLLTPEELEARREQD